VHAILKLFLITLYEKMSKPSADMYAAVRRPLIDFLS